LANNRGGSSGAGIVDHDRIRTLEAALAAWPGPNEAERARLLALLATEQIFEGDYVSRRAIADEALAVARSSGDPATVLDVLLRRGWQAIWTPDSIEELLFESEESSSLADDLADPVGRFWAAHVRSTFSIQVGNIAQVRKCESEKIRLAAEIGQPILNWVVAYSQSWLKLMEGEVAEAEHLANDALKLGSETGQPDALAFFGAQVHHIRWHQGRAAEIADMIVQVADDHPGITSYRGAAAHLLVESGRDEEARRRLEFEKQFGLTCDDDFLRFPYLDVWSRVVRHLEDREAAQILYDRLMRWPHLVMFSGITLHGAVAHHLGALATVLNQFDLAEDHFSEALRIHQELEAPFFIAVTELEWGRMLLARGNSQGTERATNLLQSTLNRAEAYDYRSLQKRAATALTAL
jgi:tetratricopeptide (TPR) repeat protein